MKNPYMPPKAEKIIDRLIGAGYKAYIVGGCVRDALYGLTPKDFDICTSARPEEVIKLFSDCRVIETGIQHGTVTVMVDGDGFEVTTFRTDGAYTDGRHPDNVTFVDGVKEDLARRDFTINAMAYNKEEGLIDPFNGKLDLENGVIRCVGNPDERFQEDALRILRAIRFSAKYGFAVERDTMDAIFRNEQLLKNISIERIQSEVEQILSSPSRSAGIYTLVARFLHIVLPSVYTNQQHTLLINPRDVGYMISRHRPRPGYEREDMLVRMAILFCGPFAEDKLNAMRVSTATKKSVLIIQNVGDGLFAKYADWSKYTSLDNANVFKPTYISRRIVNRAGKDLAIPAIKYAKIISRNSGCNELCFSAIELQVTNTIKNKEVCQLSELAINGDDLLELGYSGVDIGMILNSMLDAVMRGTFPNEKKSLIAALSF